ncbi:MAG: hypothetical protein H7331_08980, partial [Bacteroidia bacterium]|nr:hypothetical protein [Bacteroidia bacterium]
MKKYIYALALTFITINISYAQVPDSINYQAVVRNTNGTLIANGKTIRFQFIVNIGSSNYTETQIHTINNVFGLANLKIGTGTVSSAITKLKDLPWEQGNATLKIGIDTAGGTLYTTVSTSSLVTVPYAFYSDKADKAKVADDIANLNFNATTNELTVGNSTTSIPIPLVKRDTIITAFSNNNNLAIIPTAGGALGGGTTYTITAKTQDLAITNTSTNTLTLSKNGIGDNINFNQGNGIKINSTASDINFSIDDAYIKDSIKSFIKDTLKSITRVRFNNTTNKTYIYTPLPKLKLNTTTNILTIYDTLKLLSNTVDLSYFANRDTIVKVVAGLGVSVSPSTTGNVKTFTVNNTAMDKTVVFTPLTGNVTQIGGTYPNFTVYTPKATIDSLDLTSIGGNYMRITIDGKQDQGKIIRSNKLKRIGNIISSKINSPNFNLTETDDSTSLIDGILHKIVAGNLTTTINGINSNPLPIFDTITLKMPLLYNDVTVNGGSNKTITPVLKTQPINTFLAAPSTAAGTPSFRILAETDFPTSVALKTSLTPNRIPKQGAGVYLVDSKLHEVASGNIGWNTVSPLNNFVINGAGSSATFQLTNTLGGATVTSGFVAKFTGTNSFFSTQGDMFFTDNSATPIERLKLTNSDVFVGKNLAGNYISLDLSDKLKIRGNAGATGDVLTSAGPLSPPTWTTPVSASIWDKLGNTIVEKIPTDNVNLGKSSNTNAGVKLAVLPASAFDTAIYAKSFGGYGIIGETTDNTKKNYGIKGITNGIGLATLQNGFVRNTDYSAGIFGESKTA